MSKSKELFLDKELQTGGFYELAIQVCPSADNEPIKTYTDFIWNLDFVEGPFDKNFNKVEIDIENIRHEGILHIGNYSIPFFTYNIREDEPIEFGFNWFDICFHTAAIEQIFGEEYKTWDENPKVPLEIQEFFKNITIQLYKLYPFYMGIIDFEVSGQYYFDDLKSPLKQLWGYTQFVLSESNYNKVHIDNINFITKIEDL